MCLIQKKREEMLFEEKRTMDERSRRNRELSDNVYNLQCSKCFNTFCHSRQLRVILDSYFCCVESSIWNNIRIGFEGTPSVSIKHLATFKHQSKPLFRPRRMSRFVRLSSASIAKRFWEVSSNTPTSFCPPSNTMPSSYKRSNRSVTRLQKTLSELRHRDGSTSRKSTFWSSLYRWRPWFTF